MGDSNGGAGYDPVTDTYRALFDPDTPEPLSVTVISLVSEAIEKEPVSMDPLFEVIDREALDRLFRSREGGPVVSNSSFAAVR